jgi:hypothetical protein
MAFDPTGWRRLVIGEQVFFWQTDEYVLFQVRPGRGPHRLLRIVPRQCGPSDGIARIGRVITPGVVRGGIDCALTCGWPEQRPYLRLIGSGDPLRYVRPQPQWLTSTVVALAKGIDTERAFDRLPILADALQDAGCDHPDILDHCRSDCSHTWSCWVVDLLLDKT